MRPDFHEGELDGVPGGASACMAAALKWLEMFADDPDPAFDIRVSVPIFVSLTRKKTTLWCTLGVRGANLRSWYAGLPKCRPKPSSGKQGGSAEWLDMDHWLFTDAKYVILVDEFAEVELDGLRTITREELRTVCDRHRTKDEIA